MNMTKKEFWETMVAKEVKSWVKVGVTSTFVLAVFSIIVGVFLRTPSAVGEGIIYLFLAAGILCLRSRFCAIAALLIYCGDKLVGAFLLYQAGDELFTKLTAFPVMIFFVSGLWAGMNGTMQFQKDWKQYQAGKYTRVPIPETRTLGQIANTQTLADEEQ